MLSLGASRGDDTGLADITEAIHKAEAQNPLMDVKDPRFFFSGGGGLCGTVEDCERSFREESEESDDRVETRISTHTRQQNNNDNVKKLDETQTVASPSACDAAESSAARAS